MDIKRDPAILKRKKIRQALVWSFVAIAVGVGTVYVMQLEPAAPSVDANTLWRNVVKRGPMVRSVNGAGTLVPEEIMVIPATTSGRVDRIVLQPGAAVEPGTLILILSNPDLRQTVTNAELGWKSSLAQLANQAATLQDQLLTRETAVQDAASSYNVAVEGLVANRQLADQGIVADLTIRQMEAGVEQAKNRLALTTKQLETARETQQSQMAPQEVAVEQNKAAYDMALRQLRDLEVRSSLSGVLQEVNVEVGQQIGAGTALARVTDPTDLKAVIRISETQTRDLAIGLLAVIDTRNGKVRGHVARIDPASQGGTVGVDVILDEPLPPGARIDLSVDGTIELERLLDVLFVESPAFGQENSTIQLFKVLENGDAVRTTVKLGRRSVQYVEVVDGLEEGDEVILTDMSTWDGFDRVRLR